MPNGIDDIATVYSRMPWLAEFESRLIDRWNRKGPDV